MSLFTSANNEENVIEPSLISWNRERTSEELQAFIQRHAKNIEYADE